MDLQHKTFRNKGCDIHYWHRPGKSSEHIVFLHGAGCDHRMFEPQLPIFNDTCHLLLWDARGHGLSRLDSGKRFSFDDMFDDFFQALRKTPAFHGGTHWPVHGRQSCAGDLIPQAGTGFKTCIDRLYPEYGQTDRC